MASQGGLDSPVEPGIQSLVLESLLDLRYGGVRHPDADYATILGRHCLPLFLLVSIGFSPVLILNFSPHVGQVRV